MRQVPVGERPRCGCGCGLLIFTEGRAFVGNHREHPLGGVQPPLCACGCKKPVSPGPEGWRKWLKGHHARKWGSHHDNPADVQAASRLYHVYGITSEAYAALLAQQEGKCGICQVSHPGIRRGTPRFPWNVDHDHKTGRVRGLLCIKCNRGLGSFGDDPQRLIAAAAYVSGRPPRWKSMRH